MKASGVSRAKNDSVASQVQLLGRPGGGSTIKDWTCASSGSLSSGSSRTLARTIGGGGAATLAQSPGGAAAAAGGRNAGAGAVVAEPASAAGCSILCPSGVCLLWRCF